MRKLELFTLLHLQASTSETLSIFHSFTSLSSDSTLLAFFNQRHIKLHILIHYSQVIFRGRRSRQLRFGTRSSLKHLAKRAKPPKESVCSKARETRPGKQDFNLLWKNNSLFNQLSKPHTIPLELIRNFHVKQVIITEKKQWLSYRLLGLRPWVQDIIEAPGRVPLVTEPTQVSGGPGDAAIAAAHRT